VRFPVGLEDSIIVPVPTSAIATGHVIRLVDNRRRR
jgi:hypothetical protein